jgi:F-type H+-transporting ATPase subunit b
MIGGPLTNFAEETSGIGALGFDGKAFLIQLATFLLAYFVLRRYAFGPILEVLKRRRETIESSVKLTEDLQKEKDELESTVEKTLHEARVQADGMIADAQESSRQVIHEAEDKAHAKAAAIVAEADSRIATDTARAREAMKKEIVGLISDATEVIIDEKVDAKKDAALISKALQGSKSS